MSAASDYITVTSLTISSDLASSSSGPSPRVIDLSSISPKDASKLDVIFKKGARAYPSISFQVKKQLPEFATLELFTSSSTLGVTSQASPYIWLPIPAELRTPSSATHTLDVPTIHTPAGNAAVSIASKISNFTLNIRLILNDENSAAPKTIVGDLTKVGVVLKDKWEGEPAGWVEPEQPLLASRLVGATA